MHLTTAIIAGLALLIQYSVHAEALPEPIPVVLEPEAVRLEKSLDARYANEWCGVNYYSLNIYCNAGYSCCKGSQIWQCIPDTAECCSRGTFCPSGSQCMVSSTNVYYCQGSGGSTIIPVSATAAAGTTTAAGGSGPTAAPTPTPTPTPLKASGAKSQMAGLVGLMAPLAGALALL